MDALAAEAFLNAKHRVCGLWMQPLSVGHVFTLESIASPLYEANTGSEADLRLAAWICSRKPLELPRTDSWRCSLWKLRKIDLAADLARWRTYVADYCAPPQMWSKQGKPGDRRAEPSKIPSSICTVTRLMQLGMSEDRAWATPIGVASWYEAAFFEDKSGTRLDIVTESERIAIGKMKNKESSRDV